MYRTFLKIIMLALIGFGSLFCAGKTKYRKVFNINDIVGEVFTLPTNPAWGIMDRDTTIQLTAHPKLIVHFPNSECMPCALKELRHWETMAEQIKSLQDEGVFIDLLFILQTDKDNKRVKDAIIEQGFTYPVMYDPQREFEENNILPKSSLMHTFLLNSEHKVVFVGNPLLSMRQQKTFESLLRGFGKNS